METADIHDQLCSLELEVRILAGNRVAYSMWQKCCILLSALVYIGGTWWRRGWGTALQTGRLRDRFPLVSLEFFIDIIFLAALWPWGRLSLQLKWVRGIFPGGKFSRCVGLTNLPPSCADCLKIWEPYPPAQGLSRPVMGLFYLYLHILKLNHLI
jgi:hypothetical protein